VCDRISRQYTFPLGTKKLSSATMADGKGNLSEIGSRNIITTKLEELLEESRKAIEELQKALQEHRKAFEEELKAVEEEMQALISCFKKDRQSGVTQIQGAVLSSIKRKSIKIPEVTLNITPPPVTSSALSGEVVTHMADQVVSASLANRLQKMIDGSIDSRLESALDSKVHSAMLRVKPLKNKLNLPNLMLCRLILVFSVTILKIAAITLIRSRSVVL
jgi:flagellar motor component MotA